MRAAPEAAARAFGVTADEGDTLAHAAVKAGALELLHPLTRCGLDPERTFNAAGQSVLQVAAGCEDKRVVKWAQHYGTYAGRYKLAPGAPVYASADSTVHKARDVQAPPGAAAVGVKVIGKLANLKAELAGRDAFDPARIVAVLHTGAASKEERLRREREHGCTPGAPEQEGEHFVVMRLAEGSVCHSVPLSS